MPVSITISESPPRPSADLLRDAGLPVEAPRRPSQRVATMTADTPRHGGCTLRSQDSRPRDHSQAHTDSISVTGPALVTPQELFAGSVSVADGPRPGSEGSSRGT